MTFALRALGNTGLQVSPISLGTVKFGRNQGMKYLANYELPPDAVIRELLSMARDAGVNLLDTAPAYGLAEERIGALLQQRQDWLLMTKVGEEFENGQSRFDFSAQHTRYSIERSLRRLRTDVLDIVLIHSNGDDLHILQQQEVLFTLQQLKQEGKIRVIGFSGKTVEGGLLALRTMDVVMVMQHPQYLAERPVIQEALARQRGVLIKKGLISGHLAAGANCLEACLQLGLNEPGVSSFVLGTINPCHWQQNLQLCQRLLT